MIPRTLVALVTASREESVDNPQLERSIVALMSVDHITNYLLSAYLEVSIRLGITRVSNRILAYLGIYPLLLAAIMTLAGVKVAKIADSYLSWQPWALIGLTPG